MLRFSISGNLIGQFLNYSSNWYFFLRSEAMLPIYMYLWHDTSRWPWHRHTMWDTLIVYIFDWTWKETLKLIILPYVSCARTQGHLSEWLFLLVFAFRLRTVLHTYTICYNIEYRVFVCQRICPHRLLCSELCRWTDKVPALDKQWEERRNESWKMSQKSGQISCTREI